MKQYVLIHNHSYGFTPYFFQSEQNWYSEDAAELAKKLEIDYEPDKDEDITVMEMENTSNPII